MDFHSEDYGTLSYPLQISDGAGCNLFLNLAASITEDDTLTCSGTVTLYYIDLGNVTS